MSTKLSKAVSGLNTEVERIRGEIAALKAEREQVAQAPRTVAEAVAVLDDALDRIAAKFTPNAAGLLNPEARATDFTLGHGTHDRGTEAAVWLFRDQVRDRLVAEIKAADHSDGIAAGDRAARLSKIDTRLLGLEREEEALIVQAADHGMEIMRRPDADPRAVLGTTS